MRRKTASAAFIWLSWFTSPLSSSPSGHWSHGTDLGPFRKIWVRRRTDGGTYTLLVGARDDPLSPAETGELMDRLAGGGDPAAAAAGTFWGTKVLTFRVDAEP